MSKSAVQNLLNRSRWHDLITSATGCSLAGHSIGPVQAAKPQQHCTRSKSSCINHLAVLDEQPWDQAFLSGSLGFFGVLWPLQILKFGKLDSCVHAEYTWQAHGTARQQSIPCISF